MLKDFYYGKLNGQSQRLYDNILKSCLDGEKSVILNALPSEKVLAALRMEHPELYYCNLYNNSMIANKDSVRMNIEHLVRQDMIAAIDEKVRAVAETLKGSEEEIIRGAHNFLVRNTVYDYASAASNRYDHTTHSIIGPLVYHRAVCEGIAFAFKRLLDMKGIDNTVVIGKFRGDSGDFNHMWNVVSIRGQTYYVDVTQDIATTKREWNKPSYLFYMLTDEELLQTHIPEESFGCCGVKDNPFDKTGKSFTDKLGLLDYIRHIPEAQRLFYFKYKKLDAEEIQRLVIANISNRNGYRRICMTENAGRYYFYRE